MRQKLGQHFLTNRGVSAAIAEALHLAPGDTIIEIGPGHGELTQAILDQAQAKGIDGISILCIEKDAELAEATKKHFEEDPRVNILTGDALKDLPEAVSNLEAKPYKLAGNIPYYITGHLFRLVGELRHRPVTTVFMIQKEVAERIAAAPPRMNRLAAAVQFWAEPKLLFAVSRRDFDPPPEVDSAVILLASKESGNKENATAFYKALRILFAQPRKTIANNLKDGLLAEGLDAAKLKALLQACPVDQSLRPQNLKLEDVQAIASRLRADGV